METISEITTKLARVQPDVDYKDPTRKASWVIEKEKKDKIKRRKRNKVARASRKLNRKRK